MSHQLQHTVQMKPMKYLVRIELRTRNAVWFVVQCQSTGHSRLKSQSIAPVGGRRQAIVFPAIAIIFLV